jgi:energy-converting hydrogenase Eha subunit F
MASTEEKDLVFHNENFILQIARWSKVTAWGMVVIYLLRFISDLISVFGSGQFSMPTGLMDQILFVASLLSTLVFGAFYFLLLQGVAQALYVGLDIFLRGELEDEG